MSRDLSPSILLQVEKLFIEKRWQIQEDDESNISLYNRFCKRLELFDTVGQELMIQLAYNFLLMPMSKYVNAFLDSFLCLEEYSSYTDIYVLKLIEPYVNVAPKTGKIERPVTKSCDFLHYMLKTWDFSDIKLFQKVHFIDSLDKLKKAIKNDNYLIVFIDDFIGSGETAINALNTYVSEEFNGKILEIDRVKIVTLVAQQQGILNIRNKVGVDTYSNQIRQRGISDFFPIDEVPNKINIMREMENKIFLQNKKKHEYSLGYMQSEALVQMLDKSPNNTFPIFWYETETKAAPFPRYRNYKP